MSAQIGKYLNMCAQNLVPKPLSQPADILAMILFFILMIPFYYHGFSLIRRLKITYRMKIIPGIFFSFVLTFTNMNSLFYNIIFLRKYHAGDTNVYMKLLSYAKEIVFLSQIYYFKSIINVLIHFEIPGTKIMNFIAECIRYFFYALIVIRFFTVYTDFIQKYNTFSTIYSVYDDILHYFELALICFSFITLAMTFIFSNIKTFLPNKLRKLILVPMFIYPLIIFLQEIGYNITSSWLFAVWVQKNPSRNQYLVIVFRLFYSFGDFFPLLFIVWILSQDLGSEQTKQINDELELSASII